jgi:hypothetical protein
MTDRNLYALTIPSGIQVRAEQRQQKNQARQGVLGSDTGNVESIANEPGERPLTVEYPGKFARKRAAELREMAAGLSQPLPFYGISEQTPVDGYFAVSGLDRGGPVDPRSGKFQRARVSLTREGSPASHFRRIQTAPAQVDHPFGSDTSAPVGVPTAAQKVRWFQPTTKSTAIPTVQTTRTTEAGDVDILDAAAAPYNQPELLYELPFNEEGFTDVRILDTDEFSDRTADNGALQMQKVFSTSHQYIGGPEIGNNLIRTRPREDSSGALSLVTIRYSNGSYSIVNLPSSSWGVYDWDIRTIGMATAAGVAEFTDGTNFHTLRWRLHRGAEGFLFGTDDPIPSGLQTLLDPIAASHTLDPFGGIQATPTGLRSREEVV